MTATSGDVSVSADYTVTVTAAEQPAPTLESLELAGPTKVEYVQGEQLDLTGLVVTAVYSDGTTKEISYGEGGYTVSGYDANKVGKQTITIIYGGKTAEFEVTGREEADNGSTESAEAEQATETIWQPDWQQDRCSCEDRRPGNMFFRQLDF